MNISSISVGMAIRAARQAARLSLAEISDKTKMSESALSRVENGLRSLSFIEASNLVDLLKIDLENLRSLAFSFEKEGFSETTLKKRELISELKEIQRLAVLTAIQNS